VSIREFELRRSKGLLIQERGYLACARTLVEKRFGFLGIKQRLCEEDRINFTTMSNGVTLGFYLILFILSLLCLILFINGQRHFGPARFTSLPELNPPILSLHQVLFRHHP